MMNKKYTFLILSLLLAITTISVIRYVQRDTKTVVTKYPDGTKVISTYVWTQDGNLQKSIKVHVKKGMRRQKNISYYKKGTVVTINGEQYLKQEVDFGKSKIDAPRLPVYNAVFSQNKSIVMRESDEDGDNRIDGRSYYKKYIVYKSEISSQDNGIIDTWQYYDVNGYPSYSEYDSDGDGKPDTKGVRPLPKRNIITFDMRSKKSK